MLESGDGKRRHMRDEDKTKDRLIKEILRLCSKAVEVDALRDEIEMVRKEMKIALAKAEEERARSEAVISALGDGVSIQDKNFRVLYQNQAHKDMVGGDKAGQYCYAAYARSKDVCPGCPVAKAFRDGKAHTLEKSAPREKGTLHVEIKASPLRDSKGRIIAVIELVRDIGKRKRMELALQESEKRYRTLFESAGDAIFILDAEGDTPGRIVAANRAAAEMHGYTVKELSALNIADLDGPSDAKKVKERIRRILGGEWLKAEVMHRRKDGTLFPVEISAGLLEIENRKYVFAFDRDITERKEHERERENLIQELKEALDNIKTLRGLLPICAWCKKIRDDKGYWNKVEDYIEEHSDALFTHGICPECLKEHSPELYENLLRDGENRRRK